MDEFHELQRQGLITYHLLSTLFAPGDVVVDRSGPQHGLLRMVSTQYVCSKCPGLQISTQYVDYDGAAYGLEDRPLRVKPFKGSQPIEQLKYIPLSLLPEGDALVQRLITRGLRATVLNQAGYMMHAGFAEFGIVELPVERYVEGRIRIDPDGYSKYGRTISLHNMPEELQSDTGTDSAGFEHASRLS